MFHVIRDGIVCTGSVGLVTLASKIFRPRFGILLSTFGNHQTASGHHFRSVTSGLGDLTSGLTGSANRMCF